MALPCCFLSGAQDIANIGGGCTRNGFLRKQGKLERIFKFLTCKTILTLLTHTCNMLYFYQLYVLYDVRAVTYITMTFVM